MEMEMELGTNMDGVQGMEGSDGVGRSNGRTCGDGEDLRVKMDGEGAGPPRSRRATLEKENEPLERQR